jgi:hypothetical protein
MSSAAILFSLQAAPEAERAVVLDLTLQEAAVVASALLAQSVMLMNASAAQEAAGRFDRASDLFYDGHVLSRVDCRLRSAVR